MCDGVLRACVCLSCVSQRRGGVLAALLSKSAGGALGGFGTTADVLRSVRALLSYPIPVPT